jgi:hypothetical protein
MRTDCVSDGFWMLSGDRSLSGCSKWLEENGNCVSDGRKYLEENGDRLL